MQNYKSSANLTRKNSELRYRRVRDPEANLTDNDEDAKHEIFDKTEKSECLMRPGTAGATFQMKGKSMHLKDYKTLGLLVMKEGEPAKSEGIRYIGDEERVRANVRRLK